MPARVKLLTVRRVILLDSITDAGPDARGAAALCGSHGGLYPAAVASVAGLWAVILNDAGIGMERAGVAGVAALEGVGMAAAAADAATCRIGSAASLAETGVISTVNGVAAALGVEVGMPAAAAARLLARAPEPHGTLLPRGEARRSAILGAVPVALLDSAALVGLGDAGGIVVTGSHGGLVGGDPGRALKAACRIAAFNDAGAGGGLGGTGYTRLPALDARGIAAVTVGHDSARIGEARSALETGTISRANAAARALGAAEGMALRDWLAGLE